MADQFEGARTLPVKFKDFGDGTVGELLAIRSYPRSALGNKSLALSGAAVALSTIVGGIPGGATVFEFVPSASIRFTDDGTTTPSATVGIPVAAGQAWAINSDLAKVKFYGASGSVDGGFYG